jgi:hypothetical protein
VPVFNGKSSGTVNSVTSANSLTMAHHQVGAEGASVAANPAAVVAVAVANVSNFPAMEVASSVMAANSSTTRSDPAMAVEAWVAVAVVVAVAPAINGRTVATALTVILANSAMAVTQLLEVVVIAVQAVAAKAAKANAINLLNQDLASLEIHADSHTRAKLNSIESCTNF